MAQHAHQKKHVTQLPKYLKRGAQQSFIEAIIEKYQADNQLQGRTLSPDVKMVRSKTLTACFKSNTALESGQPHAELAEEYSSMRIGDLAHVGVEFTPIIHELEVYKIRNLSLICFPQWSFTPDGTPSC
jgi:hypothetical protein